MREYGYTRPGYSATYRLTDDELQIDVRTPLRSESRAVPLEQIPLQSQVVTVTAPAASFVVWVFVGWLVVTLVAMAIADGLWGVGFGLIVALGAVGGAWMSTRRRVTVFTTVNGQSVGFSARRHPWPPLEDFLAELQATKLEALERKVRTLAEVAEEAEVTRYLIWMRDAGLVGDDGLLRLQRARESVRRRGPTGFGLGAPEEDG